MSARNPKPLRFSLPPSHGAKGRGVVFIFVSPPQTAKIFAFHGFMVFYPPAPYQGGDLVLTAAVWYDACKSTGLFYVKITSLYEHNVLCKTQGFVRCYHNVEQQGSKGLFRESHLTIRHQRVAQGTSDTANRCTTRVS